MVVLEIAVAILALALGIVTMAGLYFGLLGCLGVFFHVVHCERCGHLCITSRSEPVGSCPSCKHPHLRHPLHALHHHLIPGADTSSVSAPR
jgi:hypothetical protein